MKNGVGKTGGGKRYVPRRRVKRARVRLDTWACVCVCVCVREGRNGRTLRQTNWYETVLINQISVCEVTPGGRDIQNTRGRRLRHRRRELNFKSGPAKMATF